MSLARRLKREERGWEEQEQERALSFSRNLLRQHVEDRRCEVEASIQEQ